MRAGPGARADHHRRRRRLTQAPEPRGHSFELRITCEDPATNLTPSSGTLTRIAWPSGAGIRVDSGVKEGDTVSPKFDSMMGKLIVTAQDRAAAVARVRRALGELVIEGVPTPASLFEQIFNDPDFTAENGHAFDISTKWLERTYLNREPGSLSAGQPASLSAGPRRRRRPPPSPSSSRSTTAASRSPCRRTSSTT